MPPKRKATKAAPRPATPIVPKSKIPLPFTPAAAPSSSRNGAVAAAPSSRNVTVAPAPSSSRNGTVAASPVKRARRIQFSTKEEPLEDEEQEEEASPYQPTSQVVFDEDDSEVGQDEIEGVDLDVYNYLCAFLQNGEGCTEDSLNLEEMQQAYGADLDGQASVIESCWNHSELESAVFKRLLALKAYQLNEYLVENAYEESNGLKNKKVFEKCSENAEKYHELVNVLCDARLSSDLRDNPEFQSLIVELKTLVFANKLAGGEPSSNRQKHPSGFSAYARTACKKMATPAFILSAAEKKGFTRAAAQAVQSLLSARRKRIFDAIDNNGEIENFCVDASNIADQTTALIKSLFEVANAERLPTLIPAKPTFVSKLQKDRDNLNRRVQDPLPPRHLFQPEEQVAQEEEEEEDGEPAHVRDGFKSPHKRTFWTDAQTVQLRKGVARYGHNWIKISHEFLDDARDPAQCKDRARTMLNKCRRENTNPTVWDPAYFDNRR